MCFPAAIAIPLALAAAGSVAQYFGEQRAQRARESRFNQERERQKGFEEEANAKFSDSLKATQDMLAPDAQKKAAEQRETSLAEAVTAPQADTAYLPGSSSAPAIVMGAADKANAGARTDGLALAKALGSLGGTTDQLQDLNTQIGRNSMAIGQIDAFRRGSAGVLDAELQAAANKGSTLRTLGGLAQQVGQAWLGSSLGGMGAGGSGAPVGNAVRPVFRPAPI